jgi:hypothetical protein
MDGSVGLDFECDRTGGVFVCLFVQFCIYYSDVRMSNDGDRKSDSISDDRHLRYLSITAGNGEKEAKESILVTKLMLSRFVDRLTAVTRSLRPKTGRSQIGIISCWAVYVLEPGLCLVCWN